LYILLYIVTYLGDGINLTWLNLLSPVYFTRAVDAVLLSVVWL